MFKYRYPLIFSLLILCCTSIRAQRIITGAEQLPAYIPLLRGKTVGLVVNQTSIIGRSHLVDSLLKLGIRIHVIFAPEHGFRGDHSAGAHVNSSMDARTKLPITSLYGTHKKPTQADLNGVDIVVFDIQDVGARFYTYISTLHYVMEACAEQGKKVIVLDRPNPNGHYVDGPVLEPKFRSFVGMHPVPIVHGLTIGEYAKMINGEKWLDSGRQCMLHVVTMKNYNHDSLYHLPVRPSPNLPTMESIYLYPSLCLFEGTNYSLGRGTSKPFECLGKPNSPLGDYYFTPRSIPGVAEHPPHENQKCRGFLLSYFGRTYIMRSGKIYLFWLMDLYKNDTAKTSYFTDFFDKLAGTDQLRKAIEQGKTERDIRLMWRKDLQAYLAKRKKYVLYPDFTSIIYDRQ
jgi:uncharacterized protein YbbC (DUF1343 family)